jgi:hypothetical protein
MALEAMDEYDATYYYLHVFEPSTGEYTQLCYLVGLEGQSSQHREQLVGPPRATP